jgi:hypothetical protein
MVKGMATQDADLNEWEEITKEQSDILLKEANKQYQEKV